MRGRGKVQKTDLRLQSPFAPYRYARSSIVMTTEKIWNHNCQRRWLDRVAQRRRAACQSERKRKTDTRSKRLDWPQGSESGSDDEARLAIALSWKPPTRANEY